jgi:hypothetical protein
LIRHSGFLIRHFLAAFLLLIAFQASGQEKVHLLHAGKLPPGAIGQQQLLRGGPLAGYFQPVALRAPAGARVSLAVDNQFSAPQRTPFKVGMLVGAVYRLRVTEIPERLGAEVYPTIEIINRIYPPVGEEFRFPVPIELTQADLDLALDGKFVTRVIYLEDPERALPVAEERGDDQRYFEVRPSEDPLAVADGLGRPVAILRLGGRLPDSNGPDEKFLYCSPPILAPSSLDLFSEPIEEIPGVESASSSLPVTTRRVAETSARLPVVTNGVARTSSSLPVVNPASRGRGTVRVSSTHVAHDEDSDASSSTTWRPEQPAPIAVSISDE